MTVSVAEFQGAGVQINADFLMILGLKGKDFFGQIPFLVERALKLVSWEEYDYQLHSNLAISYSTEH